MSMHHMHAVPMEARRGSQIPWKLQMVWATVLLSGTRRIQSSFTWDGIKKLNSHIMVTWYQMCESFQWLHSLFFSHLFLQETLRNHAHSNCQCLFWLSSSCCNLYPGLYMSVAKCAGYWEITEGWAPRPFCLSEDKLFSEESKYTYLYIVMIR